MGTIVTTALLAVALFALSMQQQAIIDVTGPSSQIKAEFGDLSNLLRDVSGDLQELVYFAYDVPSQAKTHLTGQAEETHATHDLQGVLDAILQKLSVAKDEIMNFYLPKIEGLGDLVSELETNATNFLSDCQEEYDKQAVKLGECDQLLFANATIIIIEDNVPEDTVDTDTEDTPERAIMDVADRPSEIKAEFGDLTNLLRDVSGDLQEIVYLAYGFPSQEKTHLTGQAEETHATHDLNGVLDAILQKLSVARDKIMNFYLPKVDELADVVSQLEFNATIFLGHCQEEYDKVVADIDLCYKLLNDNACLLYTSPRPRDATLSRMPSSA